MNSKPPQNDISTGGERREGDAEGRGIQTVHPHILNHTALTTLFLLQHRNEDESQRASIRLTLVRREVEFHP